MVRVWSDKRGNKKSWDLINESARDSASTMKTLLPTFSRPTFSWRFFFYSSDKKKKRSVDLNTRHVTTKENFIARPKKNEGYKNLSKADH